MQKDYRNETRNITTAEGRVMKTNAFLKIINPILALALIFQITTGLMHGIIPRDIFETVHGNGAGVLFICVIIHLILNWKWIRVNFVSNKT